MATIVLAHGAWSAAWAWKKMRPLFKAAGHTFFAPTYTGLGARAHLACPEIDLSTHVQDVVSEINRVSKPGRRVYRGADEIPRPMNGLGISIVSTSKGVLSDRQCRELKIGGEVLAVVS